MRQSGGSAAHTKSPIRVERALPAPLEIDDDGGTTLLAAFNSRFGRVMAPGECQRSQGPFYLGVRVRDNLPTAPS